MWIIFRKNYLKEKIDTLCCPWKLPGKNTGRYCCFLLHGIFLTQGSSPRLLHWQADSFHCASWEAHRRVLGAVNSLEGLGWGECLWNLSQSSICIKEACFFLKLHWKLLVMALKWLMINGRGQCQSPSLLPSVYKFFACTNNNLEFKMKTRVGRTERVALKYIYYHM